MEEISEALFQTPIALGTIANLEQETGATLAPGHQKAVAAVRQARSHTKLEALARGGVAPR